MIIRRNTYVCFQTKKVNLPSRTLKFFLWSEKLYFPPISVLFIPQWNWSEHLNQIFTSYQNDIFISRDWTSRRNSVSISRHYYLYKFTKKHCLPATTSGEIYGLLLVIGSGLIWKTTVFRWIWRTSLRCEVKVNAFKPSPQ